MTFDSLTEASALIKVGQTSEAQKILEPLIRANPQHIPAWLLEAETWPRVADRKRVLELGLQHNPEAGEIRQALADLGERESPPGIDWPGGWRGGILSQLARV